MGGAEAARYAGLLVSIVIIALGMKMYMWADICPQATEGLVKAMSERFGMEFSLAKNIFDLASVAVAAIVSLLFLHKITGIREGTVIAALLVGRVAGLIEKARQKK